MDEIDRALAELASKGGASAESGAAEVQKPARLDAKWQAVKDVYSFDPKMLDSDAELRRMFGSKVVSDSISRESDAELTLRAHRSAPLLLLSAHTTTLASPTTLTTPHRSSELPPSSPPQNRVGTPPPEYSSSLPTLGQNHERPEKQATAIGTPSTTVGSTERRS